MILQKIYNILLKKFDIHMQEIIRGATIAFFLKASGAGLNFVFSVVLARKLGAYGAGIFFLSLTIMTIVSTLSRVGLDNTVLRYTAINAQVNNWQAIRGLYRKSMIVVIAVAACFTLLLWVAAPAIAHYVFHEPTFANTLRLITFMAIPHAIFWLQGEFLKGIKQISFSQFIQGTCLPLLALCGALLLHNPATVAQLVLVYVIATSMTAGVGFVIWWRSSPDGRNIFRSGDFPTRKIAASSFNLFIVTIMNLTMLWAATLFLGIWGSGSDVGIYSVAQRTANLISFILLAVNSIAAPKFATLYEQKDRKGLASTAQHSAKLMTTVATPLLLLCVIKPSWVMQIFGAEFRSGALLLAIIAIGQFVNVATGSVGYLLMMSGHERLFRNCQIVTSLLCLALCIILIPRFTAIGAAIATAITASFSNIFAAYLVWRYLKIITLPIPKFLYTSSMK